jgi:hypothetical protein
MAQRITGDDALRMPEILESDRARVLAKYALGPSEDLKIKPVREPDGGAAGADFLRGVLAKEQQWRESKFSWRNLLSRREVDLLTDEDRLSFGRNMAYFYANSARLYRFLNSISYTSVLVYFFLFTAIIFFAGLVGQPAGQVEGSVVISFFILLLVLWQILVGLGSALAYGFGDRPQGMRLRDVFLLVMLGPLRPGIHDFKAAEQRDLRRIASSRKQT